MKADPQTEQEVLAAMDRLGQLYATGQTQQAIDLMVPDDDITVIESGLDEEYIGRDQILAGADRDFAGTEGDNPVHWRRRWVSTNQSGDVAWVSGENEVRANVQGRDMVFEARFTGVAERRDGEWRFHTLHFSLPHPDQEPGQSCPDPNRAADKPGIRAAS